MVVPVPSFLAVSWAMASASPVTRHHLDLYPHRFRGSDGFLGIVPWRIEQGQYALKLPCPLGVGVRHAQRAKATRGKFVDRRVDGGLDLGCIRRQREDHVAARPWSP